MDVTSKSLNYELYSKGKFGNKIKSWVSIDDFLKDNYQGSVSIRYKGLTPGQFCYYNVIDVNKVITDITSKGGKKDLIIINESAPDDYLTIQGELTRNEIGLYLFYSTLKGKMRDCMKHAISISGLQAKLLTEGESSSFLPESQFLLLSI